MQPATHLNCPVAANNAPAGLLFGVPSGALLRSPLSRWVNVPARWVMVANVHTTFCRLLISAAQAVDVT